MLPSAKKKWFYEVVRASQRGIRRGSLRFDIVNRFFWLCYLGRLSMVQFYIRTRESRVLSNGA
jgi:hypothetical protein